MPHYRIPKEDFDGWDELGENDEPPMEEYYEPAAVPCLPIDKDVQKLLEILQEFGFTKITCRYNGGYDEGFAHFGSVHHGKEKMKENDLVKFLMSCDRGEEIIARARTAKKYYSTYETSRKVMRYLIVEMADLLATKLLGSGFGTGELELKGRFECDLQTMMITDIK